MADQLLLPTIKPDMNSCNNTTTTKTNLTEQHKKKLGFDLIVITLVGWLKISIYSQIISALPSGMFLGVCDEILINLNRFGVFPTALRAHEKFMDS